MKTQFLGLSALLLLSWAGPAQASDCPGSDTLDLTFEGFGANTVGGYQPGADVYCVTSLADDGPGSFREGTRTNGAPRIIRFAQDGTIDLTQSVALPGNLTVDGRGRDVVFRGKGFRIRNAQEIILLNIAIEDVYPASEDGIQIYGPETSNVVIDHLRFSQTTGEGGSEYVDEAISVVYGSRNITVSNCRFEAWEKIMLMGNGDAPPEVDEAITATIHHNLFIDTGRRHPRGRYGTFDVYNNDYMQWSMFDWVGPPEWHISHGAKCESGCRMILEANNYERHWSPQDLLSTANHASICEKQGYLDNRGGHWIDPDTDVTLRFDLRCISSTLERPYGAFVDEAGPVLRETLLQGAGNTL